MHGLFRGETMPGTRPTYPDYPTIVHALAQAAELGPNRPGIACEARELTYGQYARVVGAMARRLQKIGVNDKNVGVMLTNSMEGVVALLGAMAAGARACPVNPNYTVRELEPILTDVSATVLVCDAASADKARGFAASLKIPHLIQVGPGGVTIDDLLGDPAGPMPLPKPEQGAAMFFTGGTTGIPKGAEHEHSNLMAFCKGVATSWPLTPDHHRILNVAPLFHVWGFCFTFVFPVYIRAFMDLMKVYSPALVLDEFQKRKITIFAGGPAALYMGLRANENFSRTDFSTLEYCLSGGAPCPAELTRFWQEATGSPIIEGLGMSEGAPIANNPLDGVRKPGSVGLVPAGTEVQTVDLETGTRVMPPGERGEIRVRGPQFAKRYRNRPDETKAAIRDGWLYTGDIGIFDEEGYLFVVDRKKEMILVGGYNVYPREIDELLFKHPAILEAATVGVPDSFSGEAIKAFIVLKPGQVLDSDELLGYCRENLVKYKIPKHIEFVTALPRSGVGKIDKLALKGLR
jgi:long-chain acyl-CoA synthetase